MCQGTRLHKRCTQSASLPDEQDILIDACSRYRFALHERLGEKLLIREERGTGCAKYIFHDLCFVYASSCQTSCHRTSVTEFDNLFDETRIVHVRTMNPTVFDNRSAAEPRRQRTIAGRTQGRCTKHHNMSYQTHNDMLVEAFNHLTVAKAKITHEPLARGSSTLTDDDSAARCSRDWVMTNASPKVGLLVLTQISLRLARKYFSTSGPLPLQGLNGANAAMSISERTEVEITIRFLH